MRWSQCLCLSRTVLMHAACQSQSWLMFDIRQADEEIRRLCSVYHSRGPAFGMVSGSGFAAVGNMVLPVWHLLRNGDAGLFHAFRHSRGAELLSGRTESDQSALGYSCYVCAQLSDSYPFLRERARVGLIGIVSWQPPLLQHYFALPPMRLGQEPWPVSDSFAIGKRHEEAEQ